MTTKISDINIFIDIMCSRPYLFGIRSSIDIYYYALGYSMCEEIHGINSNDYISYDFYYYAANKLLALNSDVIDGYNWGMIFNLLSNSDKDSINLFYSVFSNYQKEKYKYNKKFIYLNNIFSFKKLILLAI